jgi:hypothetical protein
MQAWLVSVLQVLNRHQREKLVAWSKLFKRRMMGLFTNLLIMCARCGTTTWQSDAKQWHVTAPHPEGMCVWQQWAM